MSDDAVDKFFDEMVSPASTPAESITPDEADKPGEPDAIMDDATGRDEPIAAPAAAPPAAPRPVPTGCERSAWPSAMALMSRSILPSAAFVPKNPIQCLLISFLWPAWTGQGCAE